MNHPSTASLDHRLFGELHKLSLQQPRIRRRDLRQHRAWSRERIKIVADNVRRSIPLDEEPFLTGLCMCRQSAISESESRGLVDHIHNSAGAQRMESKMVCQHPNAVPSDDWRIGPKDLRQRMFKHLPPADRRLRALPRFSAASQLHSIVVVILESSRSAHLACSAHLGIRERRSIKALQELPNLIITGHRSIKPHGKYSSLWLLAQ
jgi:hypothetical protein